MAKDLRDDLSYYLHDGSHAFRFQLRGKLSLETVRDLEQSWRTASSTIGERQVIFDISGLTEIDASGQHVLVGWRKRGALLMASSSDSQARLQMMMDQPVGLLLTLNRTIPARRFRRWTALLLQPRSCSRRARTALQPPTG